jgi:hypothetical protein
MPCHELPTCPMKSTICHKVKSVMEVVVKRSSQSSLRISLIRFNATCHRSSSDEEHQSFTKITLILVTNVIVVKRAPKIPLVVSSGTTCHRPIVCWKFFALT